MHFTKRFSNAEAIVAFSRTNKTFCDLLMQSTDILSARHLTNTSVVICGSNWGVVRAPKHLLLEAKGFLNNEAFVAQMSFDQKQRLWACLTRQGKSLPITVMGDLGPHNFPQRSA